MAFRSVEVALSTTAVKIVDAVAGDLEVWINADPNQAYWIGGDDVTTSNGLRLFGPSDTFHTKVRPGDELWAVSTTTMTANVLTRSA